MLISNYFKFNFIYNIIYFRRIIIKLAGVFRYLESAIKIISVFCNKTVPASGRWNCCMWFDVQMLAHFYYKIFTLRLNLLLFSLYCTAIQPHQQRFWIISHASGIRLTDATFFYLFVCSCNNITVKQQHMARFGLIRMVGHTSRLKWNLNKWTRKSFCI